MFSRKKLESAIILAGFKNSDMPKMIGISRAAFLRKLKGCTEFKRSEIAKMLEILNLESPKEIFFN